MRTVIKYGVVRYQILVDARYKLVLHDRTVTLPVFPILDGAAFKVTATAMNENRNEEDGIVIRDDSRPTNDHTPTEGHDPVSDVVRFARVPPPTTNQQAVAMGSLDELWIL